MNIAIDVSPLSSLHGKRGTGVYIKNLIDALERHEKQHSYILFTREQKVPDTADLVHYPYFDPFFLTLPFTKSRPTIVTVHDLIPLVFPEKFPAGIRGAVKWQIQKYSLLGARRIITDSENSKEDIERITGYPDSRIDSVYLAPDPDIKRVHVIKPLRPFILYVGDVNWNKNVLGLLNAISTVPEVQLVLVGQSFMNGELSETKEINKTIEALGVEQRIVRKASVSNNELSALYSSASCLVQPSFYEGFGLPVVDAMACGCPVVVSDTSSLHEIAGPSIRVRPLPASIAAGIVRVLSFGPGDRRKLVSAQDAWVTKFSWQKTAGQTVTSYEKAFNNHSGI